LAAHPQIRNQDIPGFMDRYIPKSVCKNIAIRGNRFFVAHTKELFDDMIALAKKGVTIYTSGARLKND